MAFEAFCSNISLSTNFLLPKSGIENDSGAFLHSEIWFMFKTWYVVKISYTNPQQVLKINHFWVFIDAIFKSLLVFRYYRNVWLKFLLYVLSKIQFFSRLKLEFNSPKVEYYAVLRNCNKHLFLLHYVDAQHTFPP